MVRFLADLDMYRKVPTDLLEGTRRGSIISYLAVVIMGTLFYLETKAFLNSQWTVDLALDNNKDPRVRVNFNITMCDLKCEFAVIDVVSVLGTDQNVTSHITKWHMDAQGVRQRFQGRNRHQNDILLKDASVKESIEALHADGEDAISLDATTFEFAKNENEYLFVDFYASWCSHCRDLAPTWETLAEVMNIAADEAVEEKVEAEGHDWTDEEYEFAHKMERPVMIAKVDCVLHQELCRRFNVRAYPSLQLFVGGKLEDEYRDHRTVMDMVHWLAEQEGKHKRGTQGKMDSMTNVAIDRMDLSEAEIAWFEEMKKHKRQHPPNLWIDEDHPGCQMAGHLMLDRVPGNFHIQARSAHHDLVPHMTNVSHIVHHLSIGEPIIQRLVTTGQRVIPAEVKSKLSPMDGNIYLTQELHEAYHHYLKVVTTNVDGMITNSQTGLKAYQILGSSQLAFYRNDVIPEAKFIYDLSPISVAYRKTSRKWYDYLTSLMAIIGGSFTVFGMCESGISAVVARKKRY